MSRKRESDLLIAVMTIVAAVVVTAYLVDAQCESRHDKLVLLLARTCVAEIGLVHGSVEECELMWQINMQNAINKRRSLSKQTRKFNSYWKSKTQRGRRPWIQHLDGSKMPKYWGRGIPWSRWKDKWLSYRSAALKFLQGPYVGVTLCPGAIDYGALGEIPKDKHMTIVKCLDGKTLQRYWRIK